VAGRTSNTAHLPRGSSRARPASTARSAQSIRGRATWRRSTPTPAVPRRWFIAQAVRTLALDLLRRRRLLGEAWELYRLNTDPAWLEHVTTDRFLHPEQFAQRYAQVFPGARFTDLYRTRALCWDAPTH